MQLKYGAVFLAIGSILTLFVFGLCFCCVKCVRGFNSGKRKRPDNKLGGTLYDVNSKYGHYLPLAQSAQPVAPQPGGPPKHSQSDAAPDYGPQPPPGYSGDQGYGSPSPTYGPPPQQQYNQGYSNQGYQSNASQQQAYNSQGGYNMAYGPPPPPYNPVYAPPPPAYGQTASPPPPRAGYGAGGPPPQGYGASGPPSPPGWGAPAGTQGQGYNNQGYNMQYGPPGPAQQY